MTTITDAPVQPRINLDVATAVKIKEAKISDLSAIVALRVNVFYPEVSIIS
jgi:hypothetical protein